MTRLTKTLLASFLVLTAPMAVADSVFANSPLTDAYNGQTDRDFRKGLQMRLAWTGDYAGPFDGNIGPASIEAIRDFQSRHGMEPNGIIDEALLRLLITESDVAERKAGFAAVNDPATGVRIGLPLALLRSEGETDMGSIWRTPDSSAEFETVRLAEAGLTLAGLYDRLSQPSDSREITRKTFGGDWFVIAGKNGDQSFYLRFEGQTGDIRGFSAAYTPNAAPEVAPSVVVASNLFDAFATPAAPGAPLNDYKGALIAGLREQAERYSQSNVGQSGAAPASLLGVGGHPTDKPYELAYASPEPFDPDETAPDRGLDYGPPDYGMAPQPDADIVYETSGSGFFVSSDGWLLTNAHVAGHCDVVTVGQYGQADAVVLDEENDLALLHVAGDVPQPLPIAVEKPRLGEDVLALGFPLRSILADSLHVTRGNVSSLMGLMNDPRYMQVSTAIQPGNSGGPLIDLAGRVVGIVTAKLNAVAVADVTGDIPQTVNFAIKTAEARRFLESEDIDYLSADPEAELQSVPDATAAVKDAIQPVVCTG